MSAQQLIIPRVGLATILAIGVVLPGVAWAGGGPLENNPARLVDQIFKQPGFSQDRIHTSPGYVRTGLCETPSLGWNPLPGVDRFIDALNGGAYCDQQTGLVWERSPAVTSFNWAKAVNHCATLQVAGWKGWSLPRREQLASLLDINSVLCLGGGLCLPDGHPFQNVQSGGYWSASTTAGSPTFAWLVNFFFGSTLVKKLDANGLAWCVRDAQSSDRQDLAAMELSHHDY